MITRLCHTDDTRVTVQDGEETWCDIEITNLVQGTQDLTQSVYRPVSVVIRLPGDLYPKRLAQAAFIASDGGGLVTRIVYAPPERSDWEVIHCQDLRPEYLFMDHQSDLDAEFGAGDHLEIDIGRQLSVSLARQLAAWPGRAGIPKRLFLDPFERGKRSRGSS